MPYCSKCGTPIQEYSRFCSGCAAPVTASTNEPRITVTTIQAGHKRNVGSAIGYWMGRHPLWTIFLAILFLGYLGTSIFDERRDPTPHPDAKTEPLQSTASNEGTAPQPTPAERFAVDLRQTLRTKYPDLDAGVTNHVLSLISDSFKNEAAQESRVKELLKNRTGLCEKEIWAIKVGYSSEVFSGDEATSLECPEQKTAHERELAPRREKFAAELSDSNTRVTVNGGTIIFDSELFSDFDARAVFVQSEINTPAYKKVYCDLELSRMQLTYRANTMTTVPIACN